MTRSHKKLRKGLVAEKVYDQMNNEDDKDMKEKV